MVMKDKRRQVRVRVTLPVEIYDVLNNRNYIGSIIDISVGGGGVSILTNEELPVHTPVSLTFTFENVDYKRIPADVVREVKKQDEEYLGLAFFNLNEQEQSRLDSLIKAVLSKKDQESQKKTRVYI